jgi:ATP-dependent DNA ligase
LAVAETNEGLQRQPHIVLPEPMLSRAGELPSGSRWAFEVKWDEFRAIVSTEDELRVRSRRPGT